MEKIKENKIKINIPFVKIYKNEIKEIIEILKEKKDFIRLIEMEINDFVLKFMSLEEFEREIKELKRELGINKIRRLKMIAYIPEEHCNIEINFNNHGVSINCDKKNIEILGIVKEIEDYFQKKTRMLSFLFRYLSIKNSFLLLIITTMLLMFFPHMEYDVVKIFAIFFLFSLYIEFFYKNIIFLKNKNELSNFFIRKKDEIILSIISIIVGAIIGAIITFFIQQN